MDGKTDWRTGEHQKWLKEQEAKKKKREQEEQEALDSANATMISVLTIVSM